VTYSPWRPTSMSCTSATGFIGVSAEISRWIFGSSAAVSGGKRGSSRAAATAICAMV